MRGAGIPRLWSVPVIIKFYFLSNWGKIGSTAHFVYNEVYNNIATSHLCLQSHCLPCSGKILWYFESLNRWLASRLLQRMKQKINYPPLRSYTGKLPPQRGTFFRLQVYERVGILLVEIFKRVGKSVIWVGEMAQRAEQMNFITL